jgi:hypothetical protein
MLRLLTAFVVVLTLVFAGIGLLFSRAWGWSEYASNELYVLYARSLDGVSKEVPPPYLLVNTDGSGDQWQLGAQTNLLMTVSCSPDGRTLAYLTSDGQLTVANESGIVYQKNVGAGYDALDAANNGTVAVSQTATGISLIVSAQGNTIPVPPDHIAYDPIKVASSGVTLWSHTAQGGIKLLSSSGETKLSLAPNASSPAWLAGEQLFTYTTYDSASFPQGGIVDPAHAMVTQVRRSLFQFGLLSPDARSVVVQFVLGDRRDHEQLYLVDPLTSRPQQQLTDDDFFHLPVCFLTFRPAMLIS